MALKNIYTFGGEPARRQLTVADFIQRRGTGKFTSTVPGTEEEAVACAEAGSDHHSIRKELSNERLRALQYVKNAVLGGISPGALESVTRPENEHFALQEALVNARPCTVDVQTWVAGKGRVFPNLPTSLPLIVQCVRQKRPFIDCAVSVAVGSLPTFAAFCANVR